MSAIVRGRVRGAQVWAVERDGRYYALDASLDDLLRDGVDAVRDQVEQAGRELSGSIHLGVPLESQEVWAAGVTYLRSRDARREESGFSAVYSDVYDAERPELFFKALPWRVVADGGEIGIRADSEWDVPEPELAVLVSRDGDVVGYLVGNDVSSRSIEGANPLYLPQAKVYDRSCALGNRIVPAWEIDDSDLRIDLLIERGGNPIFTASTSTAFLRRRPDELARWLTMSLDFPNGAVLLTGAGVVPPAEFSLACEDVVTISIEQVGSLTNRVVQVGRSHVPAPTRQVEVE